MYKSVPTYKDGEWIKTDFDSQEVAGMRAYDAMTKQLVALIEESLMSN